MINKTEMVLFLPMYPIMASVLGMPAIRRLFELSIHLLSLVIIKF